MTNPETVDIPQDPSQEVIVQAEAIEDLLVKMFDTKGMHATHAKIGVA